MAYARRSYRGSSRSNGSGRKTARIVDHGEKGGLYGLVAINGQVVKVTVKDGAGYTDKRGRPVSMFVNLVPTGRPAVRKSAVRTMMRW